MAPLGSDLIWSSDPIFGFELLSSEILPVIRPGRTLEHTRTALASVRRSGGAGLRGMDRTRSWKRDRKRVEMLRRGFRKGFSWAGRSAVRSASKRSAEPHGTQSGKQQEEVGSGQEVLTFSQTGGQTLKVVL